MTLKLWIVNLLTLIRIIGTIILIPIYNVYGGFKAGIFSLICYFTDSLDGILARKWKVSTFFGSLFDTIADKLFTITNFIVLYLITPYAIIPVIFEILICVIQLFKFTNNYNVRSNIIGKTKIWVLALTLIVMFLVSDINNVTFISNNIKEFILNIPNDKLYFWVMLPANIFEVLTFISYVFEIFRPSKKVVELNVNENIDRNKYKHNSKKEYFKDIWFNPEFYEKYKNNTNLLDLWKITKIN